MSQHKQRLRHIRTIRALLAHEAEMTHTWLRDVASDEDVAALANDFALALRDGVDITYTSHGVSR